MNETLEDRILGAVREEVAHREAVGSQSRKPARRLAPTLVAAAATVAVIAGVVTVVVGSDRAPANVEVASDAEGVPAQESATAAVAYAPAGPVSELRRMTIEPWSDSTGSPTSGPRQSQEFHSDADPSVVVAIQRQRGGLGELTGTGVASAGTVRGAQVMTLELAASGGTPMGVFWFVDSDGLTTTVSGTGSRELVMPPALVDFVESLELSDGRYVAPDGWTEVVDPQKAAERVTGVSNGEVLVMTLTESRWTPQPEPGASAVAVRGTTGILAGHQLTWRETPMTVIVVASTATPDAAAARSGEELVAIANGLRPLNEGEFGALSKSLEGWADSARINLGVAATEFAVVVEVGSPRGDRRFSAVADAVDGGAIALDLVGDETDVWIWSDDGRGIDSGRRPACASQFNLAVVPRGSSGLDVDRGCFSER